MKVRGAEVCLFRITQIIAFLLWPLTLLLSICFLLLLFLLAAISFTLIGFFSLPLLMSLIVFDLISDFSRSRFRDPVGRYIDLLLMIPEAIWSVLRSCYEKTFLLSGRVWSYARE